MALSPTAALLYPPSWPASTIAAKGDTGQESAVGIFTAAAIDQESGCSGPIMGSRPLHGVCVPCKGGAAMIRTGSRSWLGVHWASVIFPLLTVVALGVGVRPTLSHASPSIAALSPPGHAALESLMAIGHLDHEAWISTLPPAEVAVHADLVTATGTEPTSVHLSWSPHGAVASIGGFKFLVAAGTVLEPGDPTDAPTVADRFLEVYGAAFGMESNGVSASRVVGARLSALASRHVPTIPWQHARLRCDHSNPSRSRIQHSECARLHRTRSTSRARVPHLRAFR